MVDKTGLHSFIEKVNNINSRTKQLKDTIALALAEEGIRLIENESVYANSKNFVAEKDPVKDGETQIRVKDTSREDRKHIVYVEYGTGMEGMGTAKGELPLGYTYYYDSEYKTKNKYGQPGWSNKRAVVTGQIAQGRMWNVARKLKKNAKKIAIKSVKEKVENDV